MKNDSKGINLNHIPVKALLPETRKKLSQMLNRPKVLMSPNHHPRDYRGLGDLMGVNTLSNWFPGNDYVQTLLRLWAEEKPNESNLGKLIEFFELIDRFDVVDDTYEMFVKDATAFQDQPNEVSYSLELPGPTKEIVTVDDVQRYQQGLPLRTYDAFLLYVSADEEFAKLLITTLEGPRFNLHLCEKDRDFRGGIEIEWSAIQTIITKRCRKLLVILSPEFLQSDYHNYFVQLTQSLTFHQKGSHRVIPCLYKDCPLSDEFRAFHILDHRRANGLVDFWQKLYSSIVPLEQNLNNTLDHQTAVPKSSSPSVLPSDSHLVAEQSLWKAEKNVPSHDVVSKDFSASNSKRQNGKSQKEKKSNDGSKSSSSSKSLMSKLFAKKNRRAQAI